MKTVPLGDSGVAVSEVCFGIMRHWAIQKQTSFDILDRYAELGATRNQVVLAWMRKSEPPVIPVVAASTSEQMEENMGALEIEQSAEQMSKLDQASAGS